MTAYLTALITRGEDGMQNRSKCAQRMIDACKNQGIVIDPRFIWEWSRLKETVFWKVYRNRFTRSKYLAYWLWKPWIIHDALDQVKDGDIIVQIDTDLSVGDNISRFFDVAKRNSVVVIGHGFPNRNWTTGDAFYLMGCTEDKYLNAPHIWGAVHFFHKDQKTMRFIHDWEMLAANEELMTSENRYQPNYTGHCGTRWLQGVETNLAVMYGIPILDNSEAGSFTHPPFSLEECD